MALYGNILSVFATRNEELSAIGKLLDEMGLPYQQQEQTFYIGTDKRAQTRELERRLSEFVNSYVFCHIGNTQNSFVRGKGMAPGLTETVEDIFHDAVEV